MLISVTEEKGQHLAHTFRCEVGKMPFTYLGLPLGITKPTIQDFSHLVSKIENRLNGSVDFSLTKAA
jgi:hypothetical protein